MRNSRRNHDGESSVMNSLRNSGLEFRNSGEKSLKQFLEEFFQSLNDILWGIIEEIRVRILSRNSVEKYLEIFK